MFILISLADIDTNNSGFAYIHIHSVRDFAHPTTRPELENKSAVENVIIGNRHSVFMKAGRTRNAFSRKEAAKRKAIGIAPKRKRKSKLQKGRGGRRTMTQG